MPLRACRRLVGTVEACQIVQQTCYVLIGTKFFFRDCECALVQQFSDSRSTAAIIPSRASRKFPLPLDQEACRQRNVIERMFCRIKDFRRVATRYDKLARNFLATVCLAAVLAFWLN